MPRAKSRANHASRSSRKSRSSRSSSGRSAGRPEEPLHVRRYIDFVRAVLGTTPRNGR
jgi:hypothetical protein